MPKGLTVKQYQRRLGGEWHPWPFVPGIGPTELELLKVYKGNYVTWRPDYPHEHVCINFCALKLEDGREWSIDYGFYGNAERKGGT